MVLGFWTEGFEGLVFRVLGLKFYNLGFRV